MGNSSLTVESKLQCLDNLQIPLWRKRAQVLSNNPQYSAACLVLLPSFIPGIEKPLPIVNPTASPAKILTGMLKVLELSAEEYCIAWVNTPNTTSNEARIEVARENIIDALASFSAFTVLIMGDVLSKHVIGSSYISLDEERKSFRTIDGLVASVQVTYHPTEILKAPENRSKAYQDLLRLKENIAAKRAT